CVLMPSLRKTRKTTSSTGRQREILAAARSGRVRDMSLFPVFLKLEGEPALVVGGGTLAQGKIQALLHARAKVRVVAPQAQGHIAEWAQRGLLQWQARVFKPTDTRGNRLVYAATGLPAIDRAVADECRRAGVLCNAVDDPPHCDFYSPAVV